MSYRSWTENVLKRWPQNRASTAYREQLYEVAEQAKRICHLGCGYDKNHVTYPLKEQAEIVGVDLDERAGPKYHSPFWLANAEQLPFADEQFELICTEYLIEHVADPTAVLQEAHRVLAPGGSIVIVTPNLWSYKFLIAAATPYSFHKWLGQYRYRRAVDDDMFPTLYRANTVSRLHKIFHESGFREFSTHIYSNGPTWFRGMPGLFELGCLYHKVIESTALLEQLRCGMVAIATKAGEAAPLSKPLTVRCLQCQHDRMVQQQGKWRCLHCNHYYPIVGNMIYVASAPPAAREQVTQPSLTYAST